MRKVCHLTTAHSRNDIRVFFKECRSLASKYDMHLVVADGKGDEIRDAVKIYDVGVANRRVTRFMFNAFRVYRKALELNCEVYHFHDPDFIIAGVFLRARGKKVIYDAHEDVPQDIHSKYYLGILRKPLSFLFEKIENWASKKFSLIITATPHIEKRFSLINPNSVSVRNFSLPEEMVSEARPATTSNLVYVGGIREIGGIVELMEALNSLPLQLELAGPFISRDLERKIRSMPAWPKVRYHGVLDRRGVLKLLRSSLAGVVLYHDVPNYIYAEPNKLFEYMANGLPIICSHFSYWKELVVEGRCGICVDPKNPDAIVDAVLRLHGNPEEAAALGANGLNLIRSKYNWDSEAIKLQQAYQSLL